MSSLSPVVQAVRDAGEKLTGSSNLTREEFLRCVRDLDTALRSPGDDGDDACAEFCAGPPDAPHRAALAWFAGKLRKGVADGGDPMRMREDVFTTAAALRNVAARYAQRAGHRVLIVHARSRCLAISALVARWLLRPRRVYVVVTWHGFYSGHSRWRRALNGLLLRADRLILPSEAVARHLRRQYPQAAQVRVRVRVRVRVG